MKPGKVTTCQKCAHPMSAMSPEALLAAINDHLAICPQTGLQSVLN
jgi:hypothetical protein